MGDRISWKNDRRYHTNVYARPRSYCFVRSRNRGQRWSVYVVPMIQLNSQVITDRLRNAKKRLNSLSRRLRSDQEFFKMTNEISPHILIMHGNFKTRKSRNTPTRPGIYHITGDRTSQAQKDKDSFLCCRGCPRKQLK